MRPANDEDAIRYIVDEVPELRPMYEEQLNDEDGLAPYRLFECDFMTWFIDGVRSAAPEAPLRRFAAAIEVLLEKYAPRGNWPAILARVGFVETLVAEDDAELIARIRPWLGPVTTQTLDADLGLERL